MRRLLEEQDTVFGCYYAAKWETRLSRAEGERRQDLGKDVYVTCQGTRGEFEPRRS